MLRALIFSIGISVSQIGIHRSLVITSHCCVQNSVIIVIRGGSKANLHTKRRDSVELNARSSGHTGSHFIGKDILGT